MRILFSARARRGLGHFVRATAIVGALRRIAPATDTAVVPSHPLPGGLADACGAPVLPPSGGGVRGVEHLLEMGPDVIVFDTVLPPIERVLAGLSARPAVALLLREIREYALHELRRRESLRYVDRVLVPHDPEEFDPGLAGAVHVGRIARAVEPAPRRSPGADELLWVSTAGGGGFPELVEPFLRMTAAADRRLRACGLRFRHVLVPGPRYRGPLPGSGGMEIRRCEPDLAHLLARADLAVSRAGYNTVHELLATDTPFVLVPGNPGLDDQVGRARRLRDRGRAELVEPGDVDHLVGILAGWLGDPGSRPRPVPEGGGAGALRAARELLALGRKTRREGGTRE